MNVSFKLVLLPFLFAVLSISAQKQTFKKTIKINGRIQYDYEFLKRDKSDDWLNGNEFRRLHLSASGKIAPHFIYKIETNFAHASIGFRDVYIKYVNKKWGNFAIGSMAEPTGLDMATSSKYSPFFERAMLTSLQNFRWASGLHYEKFDLFNGKLTLQMSYTSNGKALEGFKDKSLEKPQNFSARITSAPVKNSEAHILLHLGLNYARRPYKDIKFRAENHLGDTYHYALLNGNRSNTYGLELAANYVSFSLQSEYKSLNIPDGSSIINMESYYVMGSYFLTGEYRPYKHAAFGRVNPIKDIEHGGLGAVEILMRYSAFNSVSQFLPNNSVAPEQIHNWTFGLNWYPTAHIRLMYNYIMTDDQNTMLGQVKGHLIRAQVDF